MKLPDKIQDAYKRIHGIPATAEVLRFCKMELMQAFWLLLLNDEFMEAFKNGILIHCGDNVIRRLFIRILLYSADYPEKYAISCLFFTKALNIIYRILIACLRTMGYCPCPRCYITKAQLQDMGTKLNLRRSANLREDEGPLRFDIASARSKVFEGGARVRGSHVDAILKSRSLVPTQV